MRTQYVISFSKSLLVSTAPHLNVSLFLFPQANGILGTMALITPIFVVRILLQFVPWELQNNGPREKELYEHLKPLYPLGLFYVRTSLLQKSLRYMQGTSAYILTSLFLEPSLVPYLVVCLPKKASPLWTHPFPSVSQFFPPYGTFREFPTAQVERSFKKII